MQTINLTEYPNVSGWRVAHDPDDHLWKITNERGRFLDTKFTDRRYAEVHLARYLDTIHRKAVEQAEKKKTSVNKQTSTTSSGVPARP